VPGPSASCWRGRSSMPPEPAAGWNWKYTTCMSPAWYAHSFSDTRIG